jgi:hypothetical protein
MSDTPQTLADRLRDEGARVIDFFNRLSQDQWEILVYTQDGNWSLHHLFAHFVSAEIGHRKLIVDIASGGIGAPPEFDIDAFNKREVDRLSNESNIDLLALFSKERTVLVDFVAGLRQENLELVGKDPFLGDVPLREIIKLTYIHLQIHLRDARRFLS